MNFSFSKNRSTSIIVGFCLGVVVILIFTNLFPKSKEEIVESVIENSSVKAMSCGLGFIDMGTYCIQSDIVSVSKPLDWYSAWDYCKTNYNKARLCTFNEWYLACNKNTLKNINNYEWVDNWCEHGDVNIVGNGSCLDVESFVNATDNFHFFRCCK